MRLSKDTQVREHLANPVCLSHVTALLDVVVRVDDSPSHTMPHNGNLQPFHNIFDGRHGAIVLVQKTKMILYELFSLGQRPVIAA